MNEDQAVAETNAVTDAPATETKLSKEAARAANITTVDMLDGDGKPTGRLVEFGKNRKLSKETFADDKGIGVRFDFINGQTRVFYIPDALLHKLAAHGAMQKIGDEMAGIDDIDDGVMAIDDLIDRLYNGEWAAKREASAMAGASILAKALVELQGKTIEEVRAFLSDKNQAQKLALRNNPRVLPIVTRLEAEKAAKSTSKKATAPVVDTDSLLNDLASGTAPAVTSTEPAPKAKGKKAADAAA